MKLLRKIEIHPGGFLLLSILVLFLEAPVLAVLLGNVLLHELGHIYMLDHYGVFIRKIYVEFTGLCIQCNFDWLPRRGGFLCAAFGPIFGLCGALLASFLGNLLSSDFLLLFAGTGVVLSLFNLLPVKPLDGWRMLHAIFPDGAKIVGNVCAVIILCVGIYVMIAGRGTALAIMGIFFLLQDNRKRFGFG